MDTKLNTNGPVSIRNEVGEVGYSLESLESVRSTGQQSKFNKLLSQQAPID